MSTTPDRLWHARSEVQVCQVLETRPETGLSASEVTDRLRRSGPNEMTERAGTPGWKKFLLQFHQVLVYVLLVAAAKAALLGEYVDAGVIFGVVLINAIVGHLQEAKAERAIGALSRMLRTESTVRREGRKQRVPSAELVPGDIVLLQSGDRVPADLRLPVNTWKKADLNRTFTTKDTSLRYWRPDASVHGRNQPNGPLAPTSV